MTKMDRNWHLQVSPFLGTSRRQAFHIGFILSLRKSKCQVTYKLEKWEVNFVGGHELARRMVTYIL